LRGQEQSPGVQLAGCSLSTPRESENCGGEVGTYKANGQLDNGVDPDHELSTSTIPRSQQWLEEPPRFYNRLQPRNALLRLLDHLPSKAQCDILVSNFVESIHAVIPLMHLPTFRQQYISFWSWLEKCDHDVTPVGIMSEIPSWVSLFFAILFASSVSCSSSQFTSTFGKIQRSVVSAKLHKSTMDALAFVSFPRSPTVYSLMAYLTLHNLLIREEEPSTPCSFIGVALRIAQAMGFHRDGSNFDLDPIQAEVQRRIWWHIIHMDVLSSIPSGLPPLMLNDSLHDTRMISELKDEYIGTTRGEEYERVVRQASSKSHITDNPKRLGVDCSKIDNTMVDVRLLVAVGRYSITTTMRHILGRQFRVGPQSMELVASLRHKIDLLGVQLKERIEQVLLMDISREQEQKASLQTPLLLSLPEDGSIPCKSVRLQSTPGNSRVFQDWARTLLNLMIDRTYCILYQPLVKEPDSELGLYVRNE
jgi:hypothetical protein